MGSNPDTITPEDYESKSAIYQVTAVAARHVLSPGRGRGSACGAAGPRAAAAPAGW
jgi:hypothetical protein